MKKLTLLLTSLLLAGVANAGFAEFTTDTPQVEEWQDFQVAHPCGVGRLHVGFHDHDGAQCAKKEWVMHCLLQNRPLDTSRGGKTCLDKCPVGKKAPDQLNFRHANKCVRENCPKNHRWQAQHQKCISFSDLENYCKSLNKIYDSEINECKATCPAEHSYQAQHKKCISYTELNAFCNTQGNQVYDPKTDACGTCPSGKVYHNGACVQLTGAICREDYRFYYNGSCVRRCTGNTVHDWDTYECVVK